MKYIKKNPEPLSLTKWNQRRGGKTPDWKSFSKSVKDSVYESLLEEQGYICCYCQRRISRRECHIEHFRPKSVYKNLIFDYKNLIASCQGEDEKRPTVPVHCGHKKRAWFDEELMISPLNPDCEQYFKYSSFGEIIATDDPEKQAAAKTTIEKLALDINKLSKMRRVAIDAALAVMEGLSDAEIEELAVSFKLPDAEGKFTPFSTVIIYMLKEYFAV